MDGLEAAKRLKGAFWQAEQNGLKAALLGRLVVLFSLGVWFALSRPYPAALHFIALVATFGFLGLAHYALVGSRFDHPWLKYVFVTADVVLLAFAFVAAPFSETPDLPPVIRFRMGVFDYFYLILAVAAFSYSPTFLIWVGMAASAAWAGSFAWTLSRMDATLTWGDIPRNASVEQALAVMLSPNFVGTGSRIHEIIVFLLVAVLLATVVHRGRRLVERQALVEAEREAVALAFRRYVPEAVVDALLARRGALEPAQRTATVLFVDVEQFTAICQTMQPADIIKMLNAYFDVVTGAIIRRNGIVTQFQGDAVLATFNAPLDDPEHATNAVRAALEILAAVEGMTFEGVSLRIRLGIATGGLVAGVVGGGGRESYTVHGDTVNLASRLEALNKEHGTRVLLAESTVRAAGSGFRFREVGTASVRGRQGEIKLFSFAR